MQISKTACRVIVIVAALSFFYLAGCETFLYGTDKKSEKTVVLAETETKKVYTKKNDDSDQITEIQRLIVKGAKSLIGKTSLYVKGKSFRYDCTGTVLAIYHYAGIDLEKYFSRYSGNGVSRLYQTASNFNLFYTPALPAPGDVIFWDNTWDRNGDKVWNDPLTHTGVVLDVAEDGTISYVHLNYVKGIVIEKMNLLNPEIHILNRNGKEIILNSPMRMRSHRYINPNKWLSSHLNKGFGMLYRMQ